MMNNNSQRQPGFFSFNGINGATGGYLLAGMSADDLTSIARGERPDRNHLFDLELRLRQGSTTTRRIKEGYSPQDLSQAGWGVIFAFQDQDKLPGIKEALREVLELRKSQAGERYREFSGPDAYRPGESKADFLERHGSGPGPADPEKIPYYLLIVGDPESIPYTFQYQLDVQYAVGRLYFDEQEDYAQYARSLVQMETGPTKLARKLALFGVKHPGDQPTEMSASQLVAPLAERLVAEDQASGWAIQSVVGEAATKAKLASLITGEEAPALLFSASHGMGFPQDDPRQLPHQGALLCADWPGPEAWQGPIPAEHYLASEDIPSDTGTLGKMGFFFACYGAGTPRLDDFTYQSIQAPTTLAGEPFIARLPQRLLGHPKGGMLAVIGHVERSWGYSFYWQRAGSQLAVFESTLQRLMAGEPVGYAMEYFNERYAELSTELTAELLGMQIGKQVDPLELAGAWTANNDARSYVVLGDPAARLALQAPVVTAGGAAALESISLEASSTKEHTPTSGQAGLEVAERELIMASMHLGDLYQSRAAGSQQSNLQRALYHYRECLELAVQLGDEHTIRSIRQRIDQVMAQIDLDQAG
ncbi:MAG: hypothetical protein JSV61_13645 [Anaerolineales bacterium]|nr:MAG: hypothetical protein JSV61_13645 [Anaerolineales bacterium]